MAQKTACQAFAAGKRPQTEIALWSRTWQLLRALL